MCSLSEKLLDAVNEMANLGEFGDCKVIINSTDHIPPHVHLLRNNDLVAKIEIPFTKVKNLQSLVILKKGREFKEYLLSDFVKWINTIDRKLNKPYYIVCSYIWDTLHK